MIEYLDLVISLTFIIFVLVYILMVESKISFKDENIEVINYKGLIEVYHILDTGVGTRYSEASSFKISVWDKKKYYLNLDYPGYTKCDTIPYITPSGGHGWVEVCI